MADYVKFEIFFEDMLKAYHNFSSHVFKVVLTNTAPDVVNDVVLADITQIAAVNGYTAGGATTSIIVSRSGGTAKVTGTGVTFTASGGGVGPFQYAVLYNDTQTSPADPLIAYWDYGAPISLLDTEQFTVSFNPTTGIFTGN